MPKVVVIYYGRFQPPHKGHVTVYQELSKKFGSKNVYIGTSDKTDPDKSPLTFEQKKKIWAKHGVPGDHIIKTRRNYNADEVKNALHLKDFKDFVFIVAIGQKDSSRLSGGKFYQQYHGTGKVDKLKTADEAGYYWVIPNVKLGGTVLSATAIRSTLRKKELDKFDLGYLAKATGLKHRDIMQVKKLMEFAMRRKWWPMLLEGGAAGHMTHPFEDLNMSFGELKKLINLAFEGKLQMASEGPITEKVDGQNLFASVVGGKVKFARNKGQLKDRGKNAMTSLDIKGKWKEVPHVRSAFMKAAATLEGGLGKLPKKTQKEIFKDGQNWVNFELIAQENPNVINYDSDVIIFHDIHMVDELGNKAGMAGKETKKLFKIFADAEKSATLKMKIQPPQIVRVDKNMTIDFSQDQREMNQLINKFAKNSGLSDSGTLGDVLRNAWAKDIAALEKKHAMDLKQTTVDKLIKRFAEYDKSFKITDWRHEIPDAAMIDDLRSIDADAGGRNKELLKPVEMLILRFGVLLLQNIDTYISASPDESVKQLRANIAAQISAIRKSKDVTAIDKMQGILQKIDQMGGFSKLVPSEGIVFKYKGTLYKITGLFAPVNQLMGIGRFGR
jgi:cytidyltransferase-like protein